MPDLNQYFYNSVDLLSVFQRGPSIGVTNPAWESILGWDEESLRVMEFMDLVHPDDLASAREENRVEWSSDETDHFGFEIRMRCRDGTYRLIEWTSRRRGDLIYATGRDTTRRRAVFSQLDEYIQKTAAIFAAATDSIIVIDRDILIAESSPAGQQIFGYPDESGYGQSVLTIVHPDDRPAVETALRRIFDDNETVTVRFRARHSDGNWIDIESRGRAMGDAAGLAVLISRDITQAVAEEAALAESLRKITAIFDTAGDVITTIDRDFVVVDTSPTSPRSSGIPSALRLNESVLERIHPADRPLVVDALRRIFEKGETATARFRFRGTGGQWLIVESRGRALVDSTGPPTTAVITSRDVTDAVAAARALEESAETNNAILAATPDGIILIDRELNVIESSPAVETIHGLAATDRRGRNVLEPMHPDDRPTAERGFRRAFDEDVPVEFRARLIHRDGHMVNVDVRGRALRDTKGPPTRLSFIARDVSESVAAEAALESSLATTRAILDSAADSIIMIDSSLCIVEASPGNERVYGYPKERRMGQVVLNIIHPDDQANVESALRRLFASESDDVTNYRFRARHADGHWMILETRGRLIHGASGGESRAVLVSRDVSASVARDEVLEEAKSEAERANHAKSEFMSRMSHELRTPLNSVLGFAQILQMEANTADEVEIGDQIYRSGQHLLNLINEVLEISRIESGTIAVTIETVALDDVIDECVGIVRPQANETGVTIVNQRDAAQLVLVDRNRLRQILLNLLSNAIKYNQSGGTVRLTRELRRGKVLLLVADTGFGIEPEHIERLFTPFDRLGADSRGIEGTGLGLALSKSLAEAMGGTLCLKGSSNEGCTFLLELVAASETA